MTCSNSIQRYLIHILILFTAENEGNVFHMTCSHSLKIGVNGYTSCSVSHLLPFKRLQTAHDFRSGSREQVVLGLVRDWGMGGAVRG